ncbi:hypothetical protein [Bacillus sp. UNCCL81]|uniref:hypothetical protein n=1 Tax=Bacillus sp. UNCCL81 TaxID=1502755 RepID=UPI0008E40952|nr:hypothetical protein [Bacillus sp. UNCCL81]SFC52176.1 hypothetical protein SAMN02799633_01080 [Bacillus sp. UNCCL81]
MEDKDYDFDETLSIAVEIGIRIQDYEEMTPYELGLHVKAFNKRLETEHKDKLTLAWLGAVWQRAEKMPSLEEVIGKQLIKEKKMSAEHMLNMVKVMNAAFEGTTY